MISFEDASTAATPAPHSPPTPQTDHSEPQHLTTTPTPNPWGPSPLQIKVGVLIRWCSDRRALATMGNGLLIRPAQIKTGDWSSFLLSYPLLFSSFSHPSFQFSHSLSVLPLFFPFISISLSICCTLFYPFASKDVQRLGGDEYDFSDQNGK